MLSQNSGDKKDVKCVLLGDTTTGKTCLLLQLCYTSNTLPRQHVESLSQLYLANLSVDDEEYRLNLWETDCTDASEQIRHLAFDDTNVFLVCFSVTDRTSFKNIADKWLQCISQHAPTVPLILVGTKTDLREDKETLSRLKAENTKPVSAKEGKNMAKKMKALAYMECSALTQKGYKEVFIEAVRAMKAGRKSSGHKCALL